VVLVPGQLDYLLRARKGLLAIDKELRKIAIYRRIKAVGIFGSDVFDKLLIIRTLGRKFPEVIFFTTDFDEIYTMESELPYGALQQDDRQGRAMAGSDR
jgi:hypothetical protein